MHGPSVGPIRKDRVERHGRSGGHLAGILRGLRRSAETGLLPAVAGVGTLLRARRSLRRGSADRGVRQAMLAVFWFGLAAVQWRGDADRPVAAGSGPDRERSERAQAGGTGSFDGGTPIEVREADADGSDGSA